MNARKKETEEITQITESLSSPTATKARSKRLSRIVKPILITTLAALCLTGGIVLHKIHTIEKQRTGQKTVKTFKQEKPFQLGVSKTHHQPTPIKIFNETPQIESVEQTKMLKPTEKEPLNVNEIAAIEQLPLKDTPLLQEPLKEVQEIGFSLADALLFKEHFLTEESCFEDYQKLLNTTHKTTLTDDVLNNLSPYCLSNQSAIKNVRDAFLKNKKKALIVYYKENNPSWLAYLKAIPASLVEIRKINPTEDTPKDLIYKAQNEIDSQNISKAIDLITKLPLTMQQKMTDFYREAAIYNRAKNSIDQLILSFEVKGE